jgi:signal transduction histidine kinase
MRCRVVTLILLFSSVTGYSQARLDTLLQQVPKCAKNNLEPLFDEVSIELGRLPFDAAFLKGNQFLKKAGRNTEPYAVVLAYRNLSRVCSSGKKELQALELIQEGLSFAKKHEDLYTRGMAHHYVVEFLHTHKLFAPALENILEATQIFRSIGDRAHVTSCHYVAASIHYEATNYLQCLEEGQEVIRYYQQLKPEEIAPESNFIRMSMHNTMGLSYVAVQQNDKAIEHYDIAEQIAREDNNVFWIGLINGNRAVVLKAMGRLEEAMSNLKTDLRVSQEHAEWVSAGSASVAISELYMDKKRIDSAEFYLDLAESLFSKTSCCPSVFWQVLSKVKAVKGNYKQAFQAQARYNFLRDSTQKKRESLNLVKIKSDYELSQKQNEIEKLARDNDLNNERIRTQNIIIGVSILSVVLLAVLIATLIRVNKKKEKTNAVIKQQFKEIEHKNEELELQGNALEETNKLIVALNSNLEEKISERTRELQTTMHELDTFLYRSSHDMRRPLSTLLGLENLAKAELKEEASFKLFGMMGNTVRSMDRMLRKLQTVYDINRMEPQWELVAIEPFIDEMKHRFEEMFPGRSFKFETLASSSQAIVSDSQLLTIVLFNLLENACNFSKCETDANIHLLMSEYPDATEFRVTDNGIGIEHQNLSRIFDQYFIGTDRSKGNGLGLFLARKAVEKLMGTIHVRSQFGIGSTFIVTLPKNDLHSRKKNLA